jgi:hypothetical protein
VEPSRYLGEQFLQPGHPGIKIFIVTTRSTTYTIKITKCGWSTRDPPDPQQTCPLHIVK